MTIAVATLSVLLLAVTGYLVMALRQVRSITRQLEQRTEDDPPRAAVTLDLVNRDLEALVARVNDTVRAAEAASTRTRVEERRFRSFIADVSHDVRTPLTTVRGYLQLLARSDLDAEQHSHLEVARRHSEELSTLVDRLYEYTYLLEVEPTLQPERLDIGVLVGECLLGMTTELEGAGLEATYEPPAALLLDTDREKLTRIVQNLLRNAIQHGRQMVALEVAAPGGRSPVGTSSAPGAPAVPGAPVAPGAPVVPGAAAGSGGAPAVPAAPAVPTASAVPTAVIAVSNRLAPGADIDPGRLFDRFYTADRSRSGRTSGLGLSIVQVLTEQLGGTAAASVDGDHLTIRVSLPHLRAE